ncbi:transcriptional regulator [Paracandidimonas soli]|nr:transcriptional regulator [Paracandidimonas soli]
MNQTDFGALAGVLKQAQLTYEKGTRKPDSAYLEAVFAHGVDVTYLVSGKRALSQADMERELDLLSTAWQALDEALLSAGKTMPADKKRLAAEALYQAVRSGDGEAAPLAKLLIKAA